MDIVEKNTPDALEAVKRQPLKPRPIYVHEAVVARLDACERKRDSFRGSGLQYVLKGLNRYCHQLSPDKLLEALRIVSQNQMFDRWTLYNLYRSIYRNVLYFGSSQHSKLMEYISECLSYTVQGYGAVAVKDYEQVSSELYNLLPDAFMEDDAVTVQSTTADVTPQTNNTELMNEIDISAFDGGPVPLSELNRLSRDIVMGVYQAYTTGGQTYRRALLGPFSMCYIYKSCLEILLKLYPAVIVHPESVLDICESLSRQLEIIIQDVTMHKDLIPFANTVCDAVNMLLFSKMKRVVNTVDIVSGIPMDIHRQMDVDLLQLDKELESSYINGNSTLQPLVVSSFLSCLKMSMAHVTVHQFDVIESIIYRLRHLCGVPLNGQYIELQLSYNMNRFISHMISYQELFSNIQSPCQVPAQDTYNKGLHEMDSLSPMKHGRPLDADIRTASFIESHKTPEISYRDDQSKVEPSQHVDIPSATMYQQDRNTWSTSYVGSFPGDQIVTDTFIKDCIVFIKERSDILYKVSVKSICHLVAIIASIHGKPTVDLKDILRSCFYRCSINSKSLTNADILYVSQLSSV
uniref:Uncharacterized protein n=1 Tax=Babesia bovis TaxID=5865 RepID=A7APC8_BABBO|eukprot:XP_001611980.1 hypothetical protein [Babesia bovis T2Bo]